MTHGSQQLRLFRIAIRDGESLNEAARIAGMSIGEAQLHAKADAINPPPEEAYQLLRLNEGEHPMSDDPFAALAVGLSADHKAETKTRTRKPKVTEAEGAQQNETDGAEAFAADDVTTGPGDRVVVDDPRADEPVPAAPGDDVDTVFDRRLERLTALVEGAQFETGTVFGDVRDLVLDLFKHRPAVWSAMSNSQQRDTIRFVEDKAKEIVRRMVLVIAREESPSIDATFLDDFKVKNDAIEAKLKIEHIDAEVLVGLYGMAGQRVVIVSADDRRFMSARRDPATDPDQPEMEFATGDPFGVKAADVDDHPADDSDLAGEDDDGDDGIESVARTDDDFDF
jgi:hypothetical protein